MYLVKVFFKCLAMRFRIVVTYGNWEGGYDLGGESMELSWIF